MALLDRVQDLLTRHPGLSRSQAVHQVLASDPEAHRRWHQGIPDEPPALAAIPSFGDEPRADLLGMPGGPSQSSS